MRDGERVVGRGGGWAMGGGEMNEGRGERCGRGGVDCRERDIVILKDITPYVLDETDYFC